MHIGRSAGHPRICIGAIFITLPMWNRKYFNFGNEMSARFVLQEWNIAMISFLFSLVICSFPTIRYVSLLLFFHSSFSFYAFNLRFNLVNTNTFESWLLSTNKFLYKYICFVNQHYQYEWHNKFPFSLFFWPCAIFDFDRHTRTHIYPYNGH